MQKIIFKNRRTELEFLNNLYRKEKGLVVIYGRRRVGKTELTKEFIKNKKAIYFLADKRGTKVNTKEFAKYCAEFFNDIPPEVNNFDDAFKYITKRWNKERLIVVIDEFPYLIEKDKSIPSVFQKIIDEIINKKNILLILSGSSMSMMYEGVLSYKSPLYGRSVGKWELTPLKVRDMLKFLEGIKIEDISRYYAVFGNMPAYLVAIDKSSSFEDNITRNILKKGGKLYKEPEIILREELTEPETYLTILESMTQSTKLSGIASLSGLKAKDMPKYFKVLMKLGIIRREISVTEKKTKKSRYYINDNLFTFWFRYCKPHLSLLEIGKEEYVFKKHIKNDLNTFIGKQFERLCLKIIEDKLGERFDKFGRFWSYYREKGERKQIEIDAVALNFRSKDIGFFEVKWKDLKLREARNILNKLKEKSMWVDWHLKDRNEYFGLIAKKINGKEKLKKEGYICYDLNDILIV
ncbi:MAG: ATP-binding protein [Candidatus Altiarchaeota archaeon]|nr:ATP-binding protein [Candidatus Altiarchaeota archaeon]